ncbi:MAG: hypothetical protein LBQ78_03870 [Tannerellaceae bacterium]|jgi:hypothetical protein|nr:hypothetical protein [Tannerellaceae bacterium]
MEKDSKQLFRELKDGILTYAELKVELFRLGAYEHTGKLVGMLSYGLILILLAFFLLLFLFLSAGFFLSGWFHSEGLGFGCIAVIYLAVIGVVVANKRRISLWVANNVIAALRAGEEKNDEIDEKERDDPSGAVNR